ncbi:MAG: hemerythrin domain-containing protein [Myxococcota bacterium]
MSLDHTGLRFRVSRAARQVQAQHERLRPIFADLGLALSRDRGRQAQTEVFRLEGALQAHFMLEEQVVFPALRGMQPEYANELQDLEQDHVRIRREIRLIVEQILDSDLALAAKTLEACVTFLAQHERREQLLLTALREDDAE